MFICRHCKILQSVFIFSCAAMILLLPPNQIINEICKKPNGKYNLTSSSTTTYTHLDPQLLAKKNDKLLWTRWVLYNLFTGYFCNLGFFYMLLRWQTNCKLLQIQVKNVKNSKHALSFVKLYLCQQANVLVHFHLMLNMFCSRLQPCMRLLRKIKNVCMCVCACVAHACT